MNSHRWFSWALLVVLLVSMVLPLSVRADGVIVVDQPDCAIGCTEPVSVGDQLIVRSLKVEVEIDQQIATTTINQRFLNPNDRVAEGIYLFPLPEGAVISQFSMMMDGQAVGATLLSAAEAQAIYEEIVRTLRDPALLSYAGRAAIQARIFPIEPGAEREISISYQETLVAQQGVVRYRYPLDAGRFSSAPIGSASLHIALSSATPLRAIYSPTHPIATSRTDDMHATIGWEAVDSRPTGDFELIYTTSDQGIGVNLLSHFDPATNQGTVMVLAAPGLDQTQTAIPKDIIIVLDTSGSMAGEKLVQAREALIDVLGRLNPEDRFTIIEFSTGVRSYASGLLPAQDAPAAIAWVRNLEASGGTDINSALLAAMAQVDASRPAYLLFLTDGLPTEGETDIATILDTVGAAAPDGIRLFSFGVGDDVDTVLLDALAQSNHGASAYVRPGEALDRAVSELYGKISTPVLTDVSLQINGAEPEELYPRPIPDLFAGSQTVLIGHYRSGGPVTIVLSGKVNGEAVTFTYSGQELATGPAYDALPRLWAARKIGYLLTQIRIHGGNEEWIQAIVDLSIKYGILTPYTSYLITEDDILTADGRNAAAGRTESTVSAAPSSGSAAVDQSQSEMALGGGASGDSAPIVAAETTGQMVIVGSRAFLRQNERWIETTFDPSTMTAIRVQFGSDDYFALLRAHPELADAFALGVEVIAMTADGTAIQVTRDPQPPLDPALLA